MLGEGNGHVTGVRLRDTVTGETTEIEADGLFVAVGHDPTTSLFLDWLDHDEAGLPRHRAALDVDEHPGRLRRRRRPGPHLPAGGDGRRLGHDGRARRAALARGAAALSPRSRPPRRRPSPTARRRLPSRGVSARWLDLVDPTREELDAALPPGVDPDVVEELLADPRPAREPRPLIEGHGSLRLRRLSSSMSPASAERTRVSGDRLRRDAGAARRPSARRPAPTSTTTWPSFGPRPSGDARSACSSIDSSTMLPTRTSTSSTPSTPRSTRSRTRSTTCRPREVRRRLAELRHVLLHRRRTVVRRRGAVARRVLDGTDRRRRARALPDRGRAALRRHVRHARPRDRGARRARETSSQASATTSSRRSRRTRTRSARSSP